MSGLGFMKILILYSSIGNGHWSAAEALVQAFNQFYPDVTVCTEDIFPPLVKDIGTRESLSYFSTIVFPKSYTSMWKSGAIDWLYHASYQITGIDHWVFKAVSECKPDMVVCTQSVPCSIIARYKHKFPGMRLVAVPTDFSIHPYWPHQNVDLMLVPSAESEIPQKFEPTNRVVTGIPVNNTFSCIQMNRGVSYQRITVFAGGSRNASYQYAAGQIMALCQQLANSSTQKHFTFIFGKNQILQNKVISLLRNHGNVNIIGYLEDVSQTIASSDLIVTKPGGLIVAECLALGRPIALLGRGSGQENANAEFIERTGCGCILPEGQELSFLESLTETMVNEMSRQAARQGRQDSSQRAVRAMMELWAA
jgi:processive 1,2-diacylglycerol beta-glucosyltransferase